MNESLLLFLLDCHPNMSHIHCRERRQHVVEFLLHDDWARALLHDGCGQEVHLVKAAWKVPSYTAGCLQHLPRRLVNADINVIIALAGQVIQPVVDRPTQLFYIWISIC